MLSLFQYQIGPSKKVKQYIKLRTEEWKKSTTQNNNVKNKKEDKKEENVLLSLQ